MFSRKFFVLSAFIVLLVGSVINIVPSAAQDDNVVLRVLYLEDGTFVVPSLDLAVEHYLSTTETSTDQIDLFGVDSIDELLAAASSGDFDIVVADTVVSDMLFEQSIVNAYCEPGQCPECEQPNPPEWCLYAQGDFTEHLVSQLNVAYCLPGQCPECERPYPFRPRWCDFAHAEIDIDILQTYFVWDSVYFPRGIPAPWYFEGVFQNVEWFEQEGLEAPRTLEELNEFVADYGDVVFVDEAITGSLRAFLEYGNVNILATDEIQSLLEDESLPGIVLGKSPSFVSGVIIIEGYTPLVLEGFYPDVTVIGAYLLETENRDHALDFMYALYEDEIQYEWFVEFGLLPSNGILVSELAVEAEGILDFVNYAAPTATREMR